MTKALTKSDPATPAINIQDALLQIVQRTDIDPERLEKFLDLQIKMENRQAEQAFNEALAGFQSECPIIPKNKKVKFNSTSYDYAPLDEIISLIKPFLSKYGLSYSFDVKAEGATSNMATTIYHKGGFSKTFYYTFDSVSDGGAMNQSQRRKSSVTYAKRAGLENALGIVTTGEDDDARRAIDDPATPEQLEQIKELMKKTSVTDAQFNERYKVDKITDLTSYEAKNAIMALKTRRTQLCTK